MDNEICDIIFVYNMTLIIYRRIVQACWLYCKCCPYCFFSNLNSASTPKLLICLCHTIAVISPSDFVPLATSRYILDAECVMFYVRIGPIVSRFYQCVQFVLYSCQTLLDFIMSLMWLLLLTAARHSGIEFNQDSSWILLCYYCTLT